MHPFARIHRLSIESRSFCSVAILRRDDGKQKYLRLYKVINLFFQSRAVGLQVVPTCCYRTVLTFLSRRRRDRLVSGSPTSSVSRDNENVLVKQARHVPSEGPARYHSAAWLPLRPVSYLEHTNEDWIRYHLNDAWNVLVNIYDAQSAVCVAKHASVSGIALRETKDSAMQYRNKYHWNRSCRASVYP